MFENLKIEEFNIDTIFNIYTGEDLILRNIEKGEILVITHSVKNNKKVYSTTIPNRKLFNHKKTLSLADRGSFKSYIQKEDFYIGTRVKALEIKETYPHSENILLFLSTIINFQKARFSYGRNACHRLDSLNISLPVKLDKTPDWEYMENYIITIRNNINFKTIDTKNYKNEINLDTTEWKDFYLNKIFFTQMGNGIDANKTTRYNPKYNYVSRSSRNNGVSDFIDEVKGIEPFSAGTITLALGGSLGIPFIQDKPFYTAQNVGILKEKEPLSIYTKLFLSTIIRNECKIKYQAFGRELNKYFKKRFIIRLPIVSNKNGILYDNTKEYSEEGYIPDWKYMENYIKSIKYGDLL